jgi:hypothetical protein
MGTDYFLLFNFSYVLYCVCTIKNFKNYLLITVKKMSQTNIQKTIISMANEVIDKEAASVSDVEDYKSVTVRLTLQEYAKLKVISGYLEQTPSGLARVILSEGIEDAFCALPQSNWVIDTSTLTVEVQKEYESMREAA